MNHSDENSLNNREWLPFVVRLYFYGGSEQVKMVHSFVYNGDQKKDFIRILGIRFDVPFAVVAGRIHLLTSVVHLSFHYCFSYYLSYLK